MNAVHPIEYVGRLDLLRMLLPDFVAMIADCVQAFPGRCNVAMPIIGDADTDHIQVLWAQLILKSDFGEAVVCRCD